MAQTHSMLLTAEVKILCNTIRMLNAAYSEKKLLHMKPQLAVQRKDFSESEGDVWVFLSCFTSRTERADFCGKGVFQSMNIF